MDIVPPSSKAFGRLVNVCTGTFDNEATVTPKNVLELEDVIEQSVRDNQDHLHLRDSKLRVHPWY